MRDIQAKKAGDKLVIDTFPWTDSEGKEIIRLGARHNIHPMLIGDLGEVTSLTSQSAPERLVQQAAVALQQAAKGRLGLTFQSGEGEFSRKYPGS